MSSQVQYKFALYRLTTDDNTLRKEWHMPLEMAAEGILLFITNVLIFPYSCNRNQAPLYVVTSNCRDRLITPIFISTNSYHTLKYLGGPGQQLCRHNLIFD